MSLQIRVDLTSGVPPYEQIRGQVTALVAAGVLTEGERLPTVRDLASDLAVATGTVQRAYRELEASGVVTSRRRLGTVVAQVPGRSEERRVGKECRSRGAPEQSRKKDRRVCGSKSVKQESRRA